MTNPIATPTGLYKAGVAGGGMFSRSPSSLPGLRETG